RRSHRAAALGWEHRSRGCLPVPRVRRRGLRDRQRAHRRRRLPARVSTDRRVVAITGAGGSLGAALSACFAGEAHTDVVLSDVDEAALAASIAGLPATRGAVETVLADVSDFDAVVAVAARAVDAFGRLDVMIANAGVLSPNGRIHNLTT